MGIHQSEKLITILLQGMGVHMIVYLNDILVLGESPSLVENHLEALMYLLTGLGFIISVQSPPQPRKSNSWVCRWTPPHYTWAYQGRSSTTSEWRWASIWRAHKWQQAVSPTDRETACCFSGSPVPAPPVTSRRPSESSVSQQPELQQVAVSVSSSPRGANLVAGTTCSMEPSALVL